MTTAGRGFLTVRPTIREEVGDSVEKRFQGDQMGFVRYLVKKERSLHGTIQIRRPGGAALKKTRKNRKKLKMHLNSLL